MRITDIARLAHVSPATVSKVLNGHDQSISEETRNRVLHIVQENNYTPYSKVWNNKATRTQTLAVFLKHNLTTEALSGFLSVVQQAGYAPLLFNAFSSEKQEQENFEILQSRHVDAVLWQPVSFPVASETVKFLTSHSTHVSVLLTNEEDDAALASSSAATVPSTVSRILFSPWDELGNRAASELLAKGHTNVGIVLPGPHFCASSSFEKQAFLTGVQRALFENANSSQPQVFEDVAHVDFEAIETGDMTALISVGEENTSELMAYLTQIHLRVPTDVSVLSLQLGSRSPISSLTLDAHYYGVHLGKLLLAHMGVDTSASPSSSASTPSSFATVDYQRAISLNGEQTLSAPRTSRHHGSIVVVGSMNLDRYFAVPQLPREGISVITNRSAMYAGGKGTNQAVGAARLGSRVSLIGKTGSDRFADKLLNTLTSEGVDTSGVIRDYQQHTGEAFIFVNHEGSSMITVLSGANDALTGEEIATQQKLFEQADYCLIQTEIPRDAVFTACTLAHQHGCRVVMKPASISSLDEQLLSLVDILVPNERELRAICSTLVTAEGEPRSQEKACAASLLAQGVHDVVVTQGIHGSTWYRLGEHSALRSTHYPSADYPTVDDTGAGDAFIAALAHCLNEGFDMDCALKRATIAAGYSTTHQGAAQSTIDSFTLEAQVETQ